MATINRRKNKPHEWKWWTDADKKDLKGYIKKCIRRRYKMKIGKDEDYLQPSRKESLDKLMPYRN